MLTLTTEDKAELLALFKEASGSCACGLSMGTREEVGHFFGGLKDLGGGNLNQGIERAFDVVEMATTVRNFGAKVGEKAAVVLLVGAIAGIAGFAWVCVAAGLKTWAQK